MKKNPMKWFRQIFATDPTRVKEGTENQMTSALRELGEKGAKIRTNLTPRRFCASSTEKPGIMGKPIEGNADLSIQFWNAATGFCTTC